MNKIRAKIKRFRAWCKTSFAILENKWYGIESYQKDIPERKKKKNLTIRIDDFDEKEK